ncbi:uncharacterized protein AC631_05478 [Debaryomyces fabryi]|uniref:Peroxisomal membrane protein PMP22 n=1 Tax=Debaryomyces fabryi TaxID=58627 RepID=A0A0V1PRY5_9ASCO|nr:uncharacterized protein AC631_05478 [Debaryomyces fabryi]KRZ98766.1 hypothetical protein AC631_05478 [Debaryomyces fabryi]CUM52445.1 unnamed protein product [Debaryomyces fabryi]
MSSNKSLNARYLFYLAKYPLFTKSITAGVLSGLNEIIASVLAKDYKYTRIADHRIKHVISPKILTMIIYGSLILTPISHQLYAILNKIYKGPNLSPIMKVAQILTSLSTITPTLAAVFVSWLSLINNYTLPTKSLNITQEIKKIGSIIKNGLRTSYLPILKSSLVTSTCTLIIAQKFIQPELWVVFFNLVFFVMGTVQNTKLKKQQQKLLKKKDD